MTSSQHPSSGDLIDFALAARVCEKLLSKSIALPTDVGLRLADDFSGSTVFAYERVSELTGLTAPEGAPRSLVLDRLEWSKANIRSIATLLERSEPTAASDGEGRRSHGAFDRLSQAATGTQLALMFSWVSKRVLGQYDMVTGDPQQDAVYYVGQNIVNLERRFAFAPKEFRLWIALHEVTHHLQFAGVPWMRDYFLSLVGRATALGRSDSSALLEASKRATETIRRGENPLAEGGIATLLAGSELIAVIREAQALMSLLEGHAEYVMSRTAPDLIPGQRRFARVLSERRRQGSPLAKFAQQALGFEAKLRQYHEGHTFIDEVIGARDEEVLKLLWQRRENLPDLQEIRQPLRWVARVAEQASKGPDTRALS